MWQLQLIASLMYVTCFQSFCNFSVTSKGCNYEVPIRHDTTWNFFIRCSDLEKEQEVKDANRITIVIVFLTYTSIFLNFLITSRIFNCTFRIPKYCCEIMLPSRSDSKETEKVVATELRVRLQFYLFACLHNFPIMFLIYCTQDDTVEEYSSFQALG